MTRLVLRRAAPVLGVVLLAGMDVTAAVARPRPIHPEIPPPPPVPSGPDRWDQLRCMLNGAGIVLKVTAVAPAAVLWRRMHSAARRSVPAWGR
jgi:hypothetical protein